MAYKGTVQEQMQRLLDDYTEEAIKASDEAIKAVAEECVQKLKNTSPKKTGDYAKGWSNKTLKKGKYIGIFAHTGTYIVHNRTDYHLTHLLENGHMIVNEKGTYGRTRAYPHIAPTEEWAADELPNAIKRKLT